MANNIQLKDIVGKNKSYIAKISKDELVNLLHSGSKELEDLADLKAIRDSIDELKNNVIRLILEDNKKLKQRVVNIEEINRKLEDDLADMEIEIAKQDRYSRRNNIEIGGIPDKFDDDQLEEVAIAILNKLEVNCVSNDLEACHRLPLTKKEKTSGHPKRSIIRFVNRKFGELALTSRKKLKDMDLSSVHEDLRNLKITIGDNLGPYDVSLLGMCKHLYSKKKISSCWSWKGSIFLKINENDRPRKVGQKSDLFSLFSDFEFF